MSPSQTPSSPQPKILPDFHPLSDSTSLYIPPTTTSSSATNTNAPSLIILFTWLGNVQLEHISKYTTAYPSLLPQAQILIIHSQIPYLTFRSFPEQKRWLEPAQAAIKACLSASGNGDGNGRVILHIFSHGGANTAIQLALLLQQDNTPFPLQGIIFDSTPSRGSFQENHAALKVSLPQSPVSRFMFQLLLVPLLAMIKLAQVIGAMHDIEDMRKALNKPELWGKGIRRLYLYSRANVMVGWRDVEAHAEEARRAGEEVEEVVSENVGHCGLAVGREEAERYWSAVRGEGKGKDVS